MLAGCLSLYGCVGRSGTSIYTTPNAGVPANGAPGTGPDGAAAPLPEEVFDYAWQLIHDHHYDPDFGGVDWLAVREELRPLAAAARSPEELRDVIRRMLGRLDGSHFALLPAGIGPLDGIGVDDAEPGTGDVGLALRLLEHGVVVTRVDAESAAADAGVAPGWLVHAIGSHPVDAWLAGIDTLRDPRAADVARYHAVLAMAAHLAGPPGTEVPVVFEDAAGERIELRLERRPAGVVTRLGNLPPLRAELRHERREYDGASIGVIRFNVWVPALAAEFDRAVDELRDANGIVIDLRGNPGGIAAMVVGIAGHFLDEPLPLGTIVNRDAMLQFTANPRRVNPDGIAVRPYSGPLAILVDPLAASTSEIFAAALQSLGRARIFGERTAGQALPSVMSRLPNGDVLQHAVADFTLADGSRIEGRGVIPDEAVAPARAELLEGRDPALEAAMEWIAAIDDR